MSKYKLDKQESIIQRLCEFLFLVVLPAFAQSFVRYFFIVGFVLIFLSGSISVNLYSISIVFMLAVYGLWKLFDDIEIFAERYLQRFKKKYKKK